MLIIVLMTPCYFIRLTIVSIYHDKTCNCFTVAKIADNNIVIKNNSIAMINNSFSCSCNVLNTVLSFSIYNNAITFYEYHIDQKIGGNLFRNLIYKKIGVNFVINFITSFIKKLV